MMTRCGEILTNAKGKIENPFNWCTDYLAIDKDGYNMLPRSDKSCAWCLAGAIHSVEPDPDWRQPCYEFIEAVIKRDYGHLKIDYEHDDTIAEFNDHEDIDHKDIMIAFDKSIELAERNPDITADATRLIIE